VARYEGQVGAHVSARRGDLKWIVEVQSGSGFAFDVRGDPAEQHDLSAQMPPDRPREILEEFRRHCAVVPPAPPRRARRSDPDEREKLRALGYAQ
jgi:hypothetical protein